MVVSYILNMKYAVVCDDGDVIIVCCCERALTDEVDWGEEELDPAPAVPNGAWPAGIYPNRPSL
jgi:hypothetical protein